MQHRGTKYYYCKGYENYIYFQKQLYKFCFPKCLISSGFLIYGDRVPPKFFHFCLLFYFVLTVPERFAATLPHQIGSSYFSLASSRNVMHLRINPQEDALDGAVLVYCPVL